MTSTSYTSAKLLAIELDWPIRAGRSRNNTHHIEDGLCASRASSIGHSNRIWSNRIKTTRVCEFSFTVH